MDKMNNSMASSVGQNREGKYTSNKTDGTVDTKQASKSMDDLAKAADNARKRLKDGIDDIADDVGQGFSNILKRAGSSIASSMNMTKFSTKVEKSVNSLTDSINYSSNKFRNGIHKFIKDALNGDNLDNLGVIQAGDKVRDKFVELSSIVSKMTESMHLSADENKRFTTILEDLQDQGLNLADVFNDAGSDLKDFRVMMKKGGDVNLTDELIEKMNLDKVSGIINSSGGELSESILKIKKSIDRDLNDSMVKLNKALDSLGPRLQAAVVAGILFGIKDQTNSLFAVVKEGFRDADMFDLAIDSVTSGQSQTEFVNSIKEMRQELRLLMGSADAMSVAGSDTFRALETQIRERFTLVGVENTKFMGEGFKLFMDLGVKPSIKGMTSYMNVLQSTGKMGNENFEEMQQAFRSLSKDKSFKSYFLAVNKGKDNITTLAESFVNLKEKTNITADGFVAFYKELAKQQQGKAVDRRVQASFAGRLAGDLGFDDKQANLIKRFTASPASLGKDERTQAESLIKQQQIRLEKKFQEFQRTGNIAGETRLEILSSNAGVAGQRDVDLVASERSGATGLFSKQANMLVEKSLTETGKLTKVLAEINNYWKGFAKSPVGKGLIMIGGAFASILPEVLGGAAAVKMSGALMSGKGEKGKLDKNDKPLKRGVGMGRNMVGIGAVLALAPAYSQAFLAAFEADSGKTVQAFGDALRESMKGGIFELAGKTIGETAAKIMEAPLLSPVHQKGLDMMTSWFSSATEMSAEEKHRLQKPRIDPFSFNDNSVAEMEAWIVKSPANIEKRLKENEIAAAGRLELAQALTVLSAKMDELVQNGKEGNKQIGQIHEENKLITKSDATKTLANDGILNVYNKNST